MDNSVSLHYKNLQCLATEFYKVFNGISPAIMKDVFPVNKATIILRTNQPFIQGLKIQSHFPTWLQKYGNLLLTT